MSWRDNPTILIAQCIVAWKMPYSIMDRVSIGSGNGFSLRHQGMTRTNFEVLKFVAQKSIIPFALSVEALKAVSLMIFNISDDDKIVRVTICYC